MNPYPFKLGQNDGEYSIQADLMDEDIYEVYYTFFQKHKYEGNGYCWEGHIVQILEKTDPELLDQLEFDPEAGAFFAYAESGEAQRKFVEILSPIFSNFELLADYVQAANRSRIDD